MLRHTEGLDKFTIKRIYETSYKTVMRKRTPTHVCQLSYETRQARMP